MIDVGDRLKMARGYMEKALKNNLGVSDLVDAYQSGELIIFAGSAISSFFPTCFPTGRDLTRMILDRIKTIGDCIGDRSANSAVEKFLARIPFEILLHFGRLATTKEKVLTLLKKLYGSGQPNSVHRFLANLLSKEKSGCFGIVTPNYDLMIEKALSDLTKDKEMETTGCGWHNQVKRITSAHDIGDLQRKNNTVSKPFLQEHLGSNLIY